MANGNTGYVRANVYDQGGTFDNETLLWYARGVAAMRARPISDPTSWDFFGAIHGIDPGLWTTYGYISGSTQMPTQQQQDLFWKQCQHGSWYFLPWHRGYLLALEAAIRAAVVSLGGPADWALPYWNYFGPGNEYVLPPAFASAAWPDGTNDNPLYVAQRYGPGNNGDVYVPLNEVNQKALLVPDFTGTADGGDPGFGGVDTGFSHGGATHGDLETQPHDYVHGLVGGMDPQHPRTLPGLMSDPDTAALDPIFYLHHANIDRLWEVWIQDPVNSHANPTDPAWLNGPASLGQRPFAMPVDPSGAATTWTYAPGDLADVSQLDYTYDDVSPESVSPAFADQLRASRPSDLTDSPSNGAPKMATPRPSAELVGASEQPVRVAGSAPVHAPVRLDAPAAARLKSNLGAAPDALTVSPATASERVFLNLENVRSAVDGPAFHVYVGAAGEDPTGNADRLAGSIALFGVRKASSADGGHGGSGITFVLEITRIAHALHLEDALDANALDVRIVPVNEVPEDAQVTIGRVSVFRQGR
jgi:tyrosinase